MRYSLASAGSRNRGFGPKIIDVLEQRGNFTLSLVDNLHAKVYVSGQRCLVGSANVTLSGLGEAEDRNNIEVLVEATIDNPGVASTLTSISRLQRTANQTLAEAARRLANRLPSTGNINDAEEYWYPRSRSPDRAYRLYSQPPLGFVGKADEILLQDLARTNLPPGRSQPNLRTAVCTLLPDIPLAGALLDEAEDTSLTRLDAMSSLKLLTDKEYTTGDSWVAFVNWMVYFCRCSMIMSGCKCSMIMSVYERTDVDEQRAIKDAGVERSDRGQGEGGTG